MNLTAANSAFPSYKLSKIRTTALGTCNSYYVAIKLQVCGKKWEVETQVQTAMCLCVHVCICTHFYNKKDAAKGHVNYRWAKCNFPLAESGTISLSNLKTP